MSIIIMIEDRITVCHERRVKGFRIFSEYISRTRSLEGDHKGMYNEGEPVSVFDILGLSNTEERAYKNLRDYAIKNEADYAVVYAAGWGDHPTKGRCFFIQSDIRKEIS
jgi:hypothetical protein